MKKRNKKIYLIIFVIIFVVGTVLFFWLRPIYDKSGIPTGKVTLEFINKQPEAKLYYPNAKVVSPFDRSMVDNNSVAFTGAVMTSNDSSEKIFAWYKNWLLAHGWQIDMNGLPRIDTQTTLQSYLKGTREIFYVAIDDPKQLTWTLGKNIPANMTIFEFRYIIKPYKNN